MAEADPRVDAREGDGLRAAVAVLDPTVALLSLVQITDDRTPVHRYRPDVIDHAGALQVGLPDGEARSR